MFIKYCLCGVLCLLLSSNVMASDYKLWLSNIPKTLGGLKAQSSDDGMNMNMGGVNMSTISRTYGGGENQIELAIMYDGSGQQVESQQAMAQFSMETADFIQKTVKVHGFNGVFQFDKSSNSMTVMVFLNGKGMMTLNADGSRDEKHFLSLAEEIKLKDIYATFK